LKRAVKLLSGPEVQEEPTEQRRVEFNFPMLTVRTQIFSGIFDKLGTLRISKLLSWVALAVVPVVAAIGLFLICTSLFTMLQVPASREITRELGPGAYLLLPGINPVLPIVYGWLGIVCAMIVHEGAHGIIARNRGLKVNSSGLLFFLFVPIGAFVDVDEDQIAKAKPRDSLRVMAGGVGANIVVAVVCLLGLLLIVNSLSPAVNGVYIYEVSEGLPAEAAGLLPDDVFVSLDNITIDSYDILNETLWNKNPGDTVYVTVARGKLWETQFSTSFNLTESDDGRAIMGVNIGELMTEERLEFYQTVTLEKLSLYLVPPALASGLVPFSDSLIQFYTHPLGTQWHVLANVLFWVWFVNVNLAVFNALPIYPLDGGRILNISLKSGRLGKLSEKTVSNITYAVTGALVCILLLLFVVPFIL
jgi:membrane-associated protease RseP (regulator of RpoE activity)